MGCGRERTAFSLISDLGFQAAEIRVLQGQLAAACARREYDVVRDLAEDLITRNERFHETYTRLLVTGAPAHWPGGDGQVHELMRGTDFTRLTEHMSV
jgi:hypothetical protein